MTSMDTVLSEHEKVVANIIAANEQQYKILSNLGKDENFIGSMFPDLILLNKVDNTPVFIIEVKRNGNIAQCIQQWKAVPSIPATLYIVVPTTDLPNAKSIAQVVGLNTKFGTYQFDAQNNVIVNYV